MSCFLDDSPSPLYLRAPFFLVSDVDGRSHHGDEEDTSAATSISDAMIDDEIADQPGLVMLGQVRCSSRIQLSTSFLRQQHLVIN